MWDEKSQIKVVFPKLSNIDMASFFETKLSYIGHFFKIGYVAVKLDHFL